MGEKDMRREEKRREEKRREEKEKRREEKRREEKRREEKRREEKRREEKRREETWVVNSRLTSVCPSVFPSVHLYVTYCCFFVILFCSREWRCCSCHVGLQPVLFATQPKSANSVSSCSSSVPSLALCEVSSDQCGGCDHQPVLVVCLCHVCGVVSVVLARLSLVSLMFFLYIFV